MEIELPYLAICTNHRLTGNAPSCGGRGADLLATQLESALQQQGIDLSLRRSHCLGLCRIGPNLRLAPQGQVLNLQGKNDLPAILSWLKQQLAS